MVCFLVTSRAHLCAYVVLFCTRPPPQQKVRDVWPAVGQAESGAAAGAGSDAEEGAEPEPAGVVVDKGARTVTEVLQCRSGVEGYYPEKIGIRQFEKWDDLVSEVAAAKGVLLPAPSANNDDDDDGDTGVQGSEAEAAQGAPPSGALPGVEEGDGSEESTGAESASRNGDGDSAGGNDDGGDDDDDDDEGDFPILPSQIDADHAGSCAAGTVEADAGHDSTDLGAGAGAGAGAGVGADGATSTAVGSSSALVATSQQGAAGDVYEGPGPSREAEAVAHLWFGWGWFAGGLVHAATNLHIRDALRRTCGVCVCVGVG